MDIPYRVCVAASIVLFVSSCTTTKTLPALDASKTTEADALVVQAEYLLEFPMPTGVIEGAGEGALTAMGSYFGEVLSSGEGAWIGIALAPVLLPVYAVVGASLSHSKDEVNAAANAFNSVRQDREFLDSIDRRFVEALNTDTMKHWACIEAVSVATGEPCSGETQITRLSLHPTFRLIVNGAYDPDIIFIGNVVAIASMEHATPEKKSDAIVEAKWPTGRNSVHISS